MVSPELPELHGVPGTPPFGSAWRRWRWRCGTGTAAAIRAAVADGDLARGAVAAWRNDPQVRCRRSPAADASRCRDPASRVPSLAGDAVLGRRLGLCGCKVGNAEILGDIAKVGVVWAREWLRLLVVGDTWSHCSSYKHTILLIMINEDDWYGIIPNEVFLALEIDVNVFSILEISGKVRHGPRKQLQ